MNTIKTYFPIFLFIITCKVYSQYTEVINSNRPGVSKSAFAVGPSVIQFEVGPYILNETHHGLNREDKSFGVDFSARYGLFFEELEVNIEGTFQSTNRVFTQTIENEETISNFKTLTVGAKYLIYDPYKKSGEEKPNLYSWKANHKFKWNNLIPAIAVYAGANFDSKNNPYAPEVEGFSPKIMISTQNNFSGGWVFVMNFIKDRIGSEQSDFQYILTLTKSLNQQWVVFGETQGISSDFYADNLIRFGGAYLWNKDFQLDTAVTFNTKDTPTVFSVNFGVSYRLDFHEDKENKTNNGASADDEGERRENKSRKSKKNKRKKIDQDFDN